MSKKIMINIGFRCNDCFPIIETKNSYETNYIQNIMLVTDGKQEYKNNVFCFKCKKKIGFYNISKKRK
jgi:hypothetical protein